jgi:hypothetical protein
MDDTQYSQAIARLRRAQPNNTALLEVLDEAQARLVGAPSLSARVIGCGIEGGMAVVVTPKLKVDRKAYMRELMRKRRAKSK